MHLNEFADPKTYALPANKYGSHPQTARAHPRGWDNAHISRPRRQPNVIDGRVAMQWD